MFKKIQTQWLAMQAHLYVQQQKYDRAIILLDAIRVLRPQDTHALKALSFAYLRSGKDKQCIACVEFLEKLPISATERKNLQLIKSHALWSLSQADEARSCMTSYLARTQ